MTKRSATEMNEDENKSNEFLNLCKNGTAHMLKKKLDEGGLVNDIQNCGLAAACKVGNTEVVTFLMDNKNKYPELEFNFSKSMENAIMYTNPYILEQLLQGNGYKIHVLDYDRFMRLAVENNKSGPFIILADHAPEDCFADDLIKTASKCGNYEIVKFLYGKAKNASAILPDILVDAIDIGNRRIIDWCYEKDKSIFKKLDNKFLVDAYEAGNLEMVNLFVSGGMDVSILKKKKKY